jgi:pimeloyl-ACP methyl ester carboxylesterase
MSHFESLGPEQEVQLSSGTIRYREIGQGSPLVFVHGALINGDVWCDLVPLLAADHRCITPDWPLGAHQLPMKPAADLSPPAMARLIIEFIEVLELEDVTVVSNDTGTAFTQLVLAQRPKRIARAVLTTGDAFNHFLPWLFKPLTVLAYLPGALWLSAQLSRPRFIQRLGFKPLTKKRLDNRLLDSWMQPARRSRAIRRDAAKMLRSIRSRFTIEAAKQLPRFGGAVLLVWSPEDGLFPVSDAEKLSQVLGGAELKLIPDSLTYLSLDQPGALAQEIEAFLRVAAARNATGSGPTGADGAELVC